MSDKPTRPMTRNLLRLRQLLEVHRGSLPATAHAIGHSDSALKDWFKNGQMPVTADLACECLLRRLGKPLRPNEVMVVRIAQELRENTEAALKLMNGGLLETFGTEDGLVMIVHVLADHAGIFKDVVQMAGGTAKRAGG